MFLLKFVIVLVFVSKVNSFWFFGEKNTVDTPSDVQSETGLESINVNNQKDSKFKHVPFEVKTVDDRLLKETFSLSQFSELDSCFHLVMSELEGSCVSMNEEELSKLSVRLMNCQSKVEGRRIYPCTSDMELKECTSGMDETVWNSYQIISNRARSVCYQIRHQQFRLKTELTVNRLVESSEDQLKSLREMEVGHDLLKQLTEETMKRVEEGQLALLDKQLELTEAQRQVEMQIEKNKHKLSEEQKMISLENMKLVEIAEKIQDRLDNATDQISSHARIQSERHEDLMDDIGHIATETKRVMESLDEGKVQVKVMREQTDEHFDSVVKNLKMINGSVAYLAELIRDVKYFIDDKMDIVMHYVNMSGKDVHFVSGIAIHVLYLFGLLIVLTFFNIPSIFKVLMLVLVASNIAAFVYWDQCLTFSNLSATLLLFITGYYMTPVGYICRKMGKKSVEETKEYLVKEQATGLSDVDLQKVIQTLEKWKHESFSQKLIQNYDDIDDNVQWGHSSFTHSDSAHIPQLTPGRRLRLSPQNSPSLQSTPMRVKRQLLKEFDFEENLSRRSSRTNSPARSKTPTRNKSPSRLNESFLNRSIRPQCTALTKSGLNCRLSCQEGSIYCHKHINSVDIDNL